MAVAGLLLKAKQEKERDVVKSLKEMKGVEVHAFEKGDIVVVIETDTGRGIEEITEKIRNISGVLGVFPTYIHYEDEFERR